jgi:Zn-finger nucleic acid-binding protein
MPDTEAGATALSRCPRDHTALTALESGAAGSRCSACDGLLLRHPAIATAIRQAGIDRDKLDGIYASPPPCPGCADMMSVFRVAGLEIDLCGSCEAVWLDKGELDKVNAYLGGDPAKNVDTCCAPAPEDFGVLGGIYSAQTDRIDTSDLRDEVWWEIAGEIRRLLRR